MPRQRKVTPSISIPVENARLSWFWRPGLVFIVVGVIPIFFGETLNVVSPLIPFGSVLVTVFGLTLVFTRFVTTTEGNYYKVRHVFFQNFVRFIGAQAGGIRPLWIWEKIDQNSPISFDISGMDLAEIDELTGDRNLPMVIAGQIMFRIVPSRAGRKEQIYLATMKSTREINLAVALLIWNAIQVLIIRKLREAMEKGDQERIDVFRTPEFQSEVKEVIAQSFANNTLGIVYQDCTPRLRFTKEIQNEINRVAGKVMGGIEITDGPVSIEVLQAALTAINTRNVSKSIEHKKSGPIPSKSSDFVQETSHLSTEVSSNKPMPSEIQDEKPLIPLPTTLSEPEVDVPIQETEESDDSKNIPSRYSKSFQDRINRLTKSNDKP
jgi:hypothetical protein